MPNIAVLLKTEISRVARKEVRAATDALKRQIASQRSEIAELKRRAHELERLVKATARSTRRGTALGQAEQGSAVSADSASDGLRFRAGGMASNRKRLGLSAGDFGLLVGASAQSIYAWEQGKSKPQAKHLAAIAALRGVGKRAIEARLEQLQAGV